MWLATGCLLQQNTGEKKDYKQLTQMIVLHWIKRKKTALVSDMDEQRILGVSGTHLNGQKCVKMSVSANIYIKTVMFCKIVNITIQKIYVGRSATPSLKMKSSIIHYTLFSEMCYLLCLKSAGCLWLLATTIDSSRLLIGDKNLGKGHVVYSSL